MPAVQAPRGRERLAGGVLPPALPRIAPFAVYILILILSSLLAGDDGIPPPVWLYPLQIGLVAALLLVCWRHYDELHGSLHSILRGCAAALLLGLLVFVAWINLDVAVLSMGLTPSVPPRAADGGLILWWVAVRLLGAALIVPLMEELFWRSFLMRWIVGADFQGINPASVGLRAVLVSSLVFGVEHQLWFAGFLAGCAYAWLYMRSGKLWHAVLAHGITNLALGVWVLATGNWQFW